MVRSLSRQDTRCSSAVLVASYSSITRIAQGNIIMHTLCNTAQCTTEFRLLADPPYRIRVIVPLPDPHNIEFRHYRLPFHIIQSNFSTLYGSLRHHWPGNAWCEARTLASFRAFQSLYKLAFLLPFVCSAALFAFWLRSSVVSVLFSLISETGLRTNSRLFLFLKPADKSLGLLILVGTVSLLSALSGADANLPFSLRLLA